jgi:hypothetical protein
MNGWHLEWLFGERSLLLTHTGRRTGLRRQTVLEVVEYWNEGPLRSSWQMNSVLILTGFATFRRSPTKK